MDELKQSRTSQAHSAAEVKRLLSQLTRLEENAEADLQRAAEEVCSTVPDASCEMWSETVDTVALRQVLCNVKIGLQV